MSGWVEALLVVVGLGGVLVVIDSVVRTFVLPRASLAPLSRLLVGLLWLVFAGLARSRRSYRHRDRVMAMYAPVLLVSMPVVWLVLLWLAFTPLVLVAGRHSGALTARSGGSTSDWLLALRQSGSNLWTLGFEPPSGTLAASLSFAEATAGPIVVALLISYVPTIYATFSAREQMVTQLEIRAATPPTPTALLRRAQAAGYLADIDAYLAEWERWFVQLQETHTSLVPLIFLRSPHPDRSWITAAGAVLDTAALRMSVVDLAFRPSGGLCIRAGSLALRQVSDLVGIAYDADPRPGDPLTITRTEFDEVVSQLREANVPVVEDLEAAWIAFRGWRINYDVPLVGLAGKLMAPLAPWSSDRSLRRARPRLSLRWRGTHR